MKTPLIFLILFASILCKTSFGAPKIILKLDDLKAKTNWCPSIPTMDYLLQKKIKAGFGAIANQFDATAFKMLSPYLNATNSDGDKLFEIWNHGLDHMRPEFKGTTYAYQKDNFVYAHIMNNNIGQFYLKKLKNKIKNATLLFDGSEMIVSKFWLDVDIKPIDKPFIANDDTFMNFGKPTAVTYALPDPVNTVVKIELTK